MKKEISLKEFYLRHYKDTPPQDNMKDDTTFYGLLEVIENHESVDEYLFTDNPNERIRNRIITSLCEHYDIEYDYLKNHLKMCKKSLTDNQ